MTYHEKIKLMGKSKKIKKQLEWKKRKNYKNYKKMQNEERFNKRRVVFPAHKLLRVKKM